MKDKELDTKDWLKVCEVFNSISGEGLNAGKLATFIRFSGCNLCCPYCDTQYHKEIRYLIDVDEKDMRTYNGENAGELKEQQKEFFSKLDSNIEYFVFTGGEPSCQNLEQIHRLISYLYTTRYNLCVEMETNGLYLDNFVRYYSSWHEKGIVIFSADFKTDYMNDYKYALGAYLGYKMLNKRDCIKVVVKNTDEIDIAKKLADKFTNTNVIVSPCYKQISPTKIAEYMIEKKYSNLRMQIQLHKELWNPNERAR